MATLPLPSNVYHVLERILQERTTFATCVELFDLPDVRAAAEDANKVSDALGNLYRRGYLVREPAAKTPRSQAKWAYAWKRVKATRDIPPVEHAAMMARAYDARPQVAEPVTNTFIDKPSLRISESGGRVVIELAKLRITIEPSG